MLGIWRTSGGGNDSTSGGGTSSADVDDFKQELVYLMDTLLDEKASPNLKHLSTIQLAKKCVSADFRRFLRTQTASLNKIFLALNDAAVNSQATALTSAVIIYFLARDQKSFPITEAPLRLISELLKQPQQQDTAAAADLEYKKQLKVVWAIVKDWLEVSTEKSTKQIQFDLTEETLCTPFLMLEALAYISMRERTDFFKQELLVSGCLQWVVARLDKAVLNLSHFTTTTNYETQTMLTLKEVERCLRILENAAAFNKKNQAYLISHRNGLLLFACAKFLTFFQKFFDPPSPSDAADTAVESTSSPPKIQKLDISSQPEPTITITISPTLTAQIIDCVCQTCRVLMNLSHENELCCLKLGQIAGFLNNCLNTITYLAPKHCPKEKFFDVSVMMYGLLVNVVERCAANRRKVLSLRMPLFEPDTTAAAAAINEGDVPTLEAMAKLFVRHDSAAKVLDEELDNDLAFEEPDEEGDGATGGGPPLQSSSINGGRLDRQLELSEDEMLNAVQSAMQKASAHMEDSMIASYLSLLIGCLVQTDAGLANEVKALMPDNDMSIMIDQLKRFLDFMRLTNPKASATRSVERILQSLQLAAGL